MSAERRFATGDWYAVVGDHVSVMLPGSERSRVAALWELADSGATADAMLDALLADGLSGLPSFALVGSSDDATRVIVRGVPTATVTTDAGEQVIGAAPGSTWNEQVLIGVTGGRVTFDGDGDRATDHILTPGLARISVLEFGAPSVAAPAIESAPTPPAEREAPVLALVEEPGSEADPTPTGETPAVPVATEAPEASDAPGDDWSDRDGQTTVGAPSPDFERPPVPGQEIAPSVVSSPVASLVFSTGDVVDVDRAVLVGRAPEAHQFASHDQPYVVTVASPNQEISSTHLEIRPGAGADHGSAVATDLGSTNGTILLQPGLEPEELKPGIAVSLIPGAVLDLGDGVTIQVTNP